ncbi:ABC transporter ATP-binding protein [Agromyces aerolatus]|uniref:ABC transporter ATP-binding protein n=1 Tax=Agromyces sp. LY-1074 TaxID=3074080 RepID=UPI00285A1350|nr:MULTISPECIES: ATP-binding cassette domain-containing protein [unclassified Agromyces]MDR5699001.1 ATP-binding cassette domain-containing protein [Agromyces sp. LY-1074]MDR5705221.1 ATP-binding cassette domain-containing protein [Agromyces sp. LY-1358]
MSSLRFDAVRVQFGTRRSPIVAVDDVSFDVPSGKIVGLVGESGSGKSTLARAAVGLVPLAGGRILVDETPVGELSHRPMQMVFQDPFSSLDPRMSIGASIAETMPRGRSRAERAAEVARLMELVHLDPARATGLPAGLSGGQRQRVAIARALAAEPSIVIADEITSALDVSIQGSVLNLVRELRSELGLSMLFITHNLAVVRYVADEIVVMRHGRVLEQGPTREVLEAPKHEYTRALLHAVPGRIPAEDPDRATTPDRTMTPTPIR